MKLIVRITSLFLTSLPLIVVAFANGYPLVFPDTGVYIEQALSLKGDSSRPPYYSLFILPFHLGKSLWPIVFIQSFLLTFVLYLSTRVLFGSPPKLTYLTIVLTFLVMFTSVGWHASQIMPDLFTAVLVLCIYLLVFGWKELSRLERSAVWLMLIVAIMFHYGNLPLVLALGTFALLLLWWQAEPWSAIVRAFVVFAGAASIAAVAFVAYSVAYTGKATLSPDGARFALGRLIEDGTAIAYIKRSCPNSGYALCRYVESLKADTNWFLWDAASPWGNIERELGFYGARTEAKEIIRGTLETYPYTQALASIQNAFAQLGMFSIVNSIYPCLGDARVNQVIARHFQGEHRQFAASRQNTSTLPLTMIQLLHGATMVISLLVLLLYVIHPWFRYRRSPSLRSRSLMFLSILLAALYINAAICGALAGPVDRYQGRLAWLLVFAAIVLLIPPQTRLPE
ncbi:MAG: hypothetical protein U1F76_18220 [Candidatus Competibacteraceae bacterium]